MFKDSVMQAVTLSQAQKDLPGLIAHVVNDAEPVIICNDAGQQVVCLSLDDFNAWQETVYLLSNPANAAHLRKSLAESASGAVQERELAQP
jgi:antitoxin YefM